MLRNSFAIFCLFPPLLCFLQTVSDTSCPPFLIMNFFFVVVVGCPWLFFPPSPSPHEKNCWLFPEFTKIPCDGSAPRRRNTTIRLAIRNDAFFFFIYSSKEKSGAKRVFVDLFSHYSRHLIVFLAIGRIFKRIDLFFFSLLLTHLCYMRFHLLK